MIELTEKLASILGQHSLTEWEAKETADLAAGKKGMRTPKEMRRELENGESSPLGARWRKTKRAANKKAREKAKHDSMPSTKFKKAIAAARAMRRDGATIKEIAFRTGLYWRTVLEHTKQDKT